MMRHKILAMVLTMLLLLPGYSNAAGCWPQVTDPLQQVGQTRLKVLLFRVYDAVLYTDSGEYPTAGSVALSLNYLRNIRASQLLESTLEQWQKQGFDNTDQQQEWLAQLARIWPDVQRGDCLLAYSPDGQSVHFYHADGLLGKIEDHLFYQQFFAIWLSEESSYRRNRDELTGAGK